MNERLKAYLPLLWFICLPLLIFGPILAQGKALGPWDDVDRFFHPEREVTQPYDVLQMDGALQFYGWRKLVFESWGRGEVPGWNPYELGGTPLLANSQSAAFYPFHILCGVLHVPVAPAMAFLAWLHLTIAGLGIFWLVRRLGGSLLSSVVGGTSFALSAFALSWINLPSVMTTCCWIPVALVGLCELRESAPRWERLIGISGASIALMFLGGHLQFAFYGVIAYFVVGIGFVIESRRWQGLGFLIAPLLLGAIIASVQLVPVLKYSANSHRRSAPTAEGLAAYNASGIRLYEWTALIDPTAVGKIDQFGPFGKATSSYWPALTKVGANPAESAISIGPILLVGLVALLYRRSKAHGGLWALLILAALMAAGTPINAAFYYGLPGFSATGSPGRVAVLFVLAASVLGALGIDALRLGEPNLKQKWPPFAIVAVIWLLCGTQAFGALNSLKTVLPQAPSDTMLRFQSTVASPYFMGVTIPILLLLLAGMFRSLPVIKDGKWLVLLVAPIWAMTMGIRPRSGDVVAPPDFKFYSIERVAFINRDWEILGQLPAVMPPNLSTIFGIRELGGYDSLIDKGTVALLRDINGEDPAPAANGNMMFIKPSFDPDKLRKAGISRVISREIFQKLLSTDRMGEWYEYDLHSAGRAQNSNNFSTTINEDMADRVHILTSGPATLTLYDRNLPGWTAEVDGRPQPILEGPWRAVNLGPGVHHVVFQYHPTDFAANNLSLVGVLVLISAITWNRIKSSTFSQGNG